MDNRMSEFLLGLVWNWGESDTAIIPPSSQLADLCRTPTLNRDDILLLLRGSEIHDSIRKGEYAKPFEPQQSNE